MGGQRGKDFNLRKACKALTHATTAVADLSGAYQVVCENDGARPSVIVHNQREELQSLTAQLEACKNHVDVLRHNIKLRDDYAMDLEKENGELSRKLEYNQDPARNKLFEDLQKAEAEVVALGELVDALREREAILMEDARSAKAQLRQERAENERLRTAVKTLEEKDRSSAKETQALLQKVDAQRRTLNQQNVGIAKVKKNNAVLREYAARKKHEAQIAEERVAVYDAEATDKTYNLGYYSDPSPHIREVKRIKKALGQEYCRMDNECKKHRVLTAFHDRQVLRLDRIRTSAEKLAEEAKQDAENLKNTLNEVRGYNRTNLKKVEALKMQLNAAMARMAEMEPATRWQCSKCTRRTPLIAGGQAAASAVNDRGNQARNDQDEIELNEAAAQGLAVLSPASPVTTAFASSVAHGHASRSRRA